MDQSKKVFQRGGLSKEVPGTCVLYASVTSKADLLFRGGPSPGGGGGGGGSKGGTACYANNWYTTIQDLHTPLQVIEPMFPVMAPSGHCRQ